MKVKKFILPLMAGVMLASCGGNSSASASGLSSQQTSASGLSTSSSQSQTTFEPFTLSQVHDARVAKTLPSLENKTVSIKGKVTFAKVGESSDGVMTMQSGKYAIEVTCPEASLAKVGDAIEVKGKFVGLYQGDVDTLWVSAYPDTIRDGSIKVIDEAINVEKVTILKEADLVEYECSVATVAFTVTGMRSSAAFVGKLTQGDEEFIVANKLGISERFDEPPFAVGDKCKYEGVFGYTSNSQSRIFRYYDKNGFTPAN